MNFVVGIPMSPLMYFSCKYDWILQPKRLRENHRRCKWPPASWMSTWRGLQPSTRVLIAERNEDRNRKQQSAILGWNQSLQDRSCEPVEGLSRPGWHLHRKLGIGSHRVGMSDWRLLLHVFRVGGGRWSGSHSAPERSVQFLPSDFAFVVDKLPPPRVVAQSKHFGSDQILPPALGAWNIWLDSTAIFVPFRRCLLYVSIYLFLNFVVWYLCICWNSIA